MTEKTKGAARTTTAQTAQAPSKGTRNNNSNSEIKKQAYAIINIFTDPENPPKDIYRYMGIMNGDTIIENYAIISRNTASIIKMMLDKVWGQS